MTGLDAGTVQHLPAFTDATIGSHQRWRAKCPSRGGSRCLRSGLGWLRRSSRRTNLMPRGATKPPLRCCGNGVYSRTEKPPETPPLDPPKSVAGFSFSFLEQSSGIAIIGCLHTLLAEIEQQGPVARAPHAMGLFCAESQRVWRQ